MRLLHTSDWHLGRSFHGVGMLAAQRNFVDQLLETVREEKVDILLLAGDVYDRALPGVDVVNLLDDALSRLTAEGVAVVLTSGNHDSATRLGFAGKVLERGGVHLRTRIDGLDVPVMFELGRDATGKDAQLAIYGLPFLEPRTVAEALGVEQPSHFTVTEAALQRVRTHLAQQSRPTHSVVLAHTFASGGISSDSERELSVGGVGAVPLDLFDGFAYTALGHLHGRQMLSETVRYSGSPLAYSFSEARQDKGGWLLEIGPDGLEFVKPIPWPASKELAVLRGGLEQLLTAGEHAHAETAYCQITLTDNERPAHAMERLRSRFPQTLVLAFEPADARTKGPTSYSDRVATAANELELCCGFLEHVRGRSTSVEDKAVLLGSLDAVRLQEAGK
ncbi:exonuclease SbcCD subunit D [Paenarthrobacter sp. PH39-S1]|uniref:exonuclease SbcCD subunit D n=1 Tax=Paenarthrobacter sp. PH39-S1 TaxID=3046204 RepID=UPI0024BB8344|nr:exonuclease SbcCD subunit D [Paenarthrobacter sp. PH39-S1]MDJ0358334.1 exonuclease SbcCD subunit D [Paenarthrobacter sp. PH39-S1]